MLQVDFINQLGGNNVSDCYFLCHFLPPARRLLLTLLSEDSKKVGLCLVLKDMVVSTLVFRLGGLLPQDLDPVKQEVNFDGYPDASKERNEPTKANSPWNWILA